MPSDDAKTLIKEQGRLEQNRFAFNNWWQEIALRVMPKDAQFTVTNEEGQKRMERLFDSRAVTSNERFAAVMEDLLTPRTQAWHGLLAEDEELADDQAVKEYLERLNKLLLSMRYRPKANFASQKHEGYLSLGAFGNSCLFIDEELGTGPRYKQYPLREVFWDENHEGLIDTLYRRFHWSARNAYRRFGKQLPPKILQDATDSNANPLKEWEFIHCVRPNDERVTGRKDYRGMAFQSWYIAVDAETTLERGGYRAWPFAIGRYMVASSETYGRSPAMAAWPAIMTINEEKKTVLRAGQKQTDPPILTTDDGALSPFDLRSAAINYGGLDSEGNELVKPFQTGADIPLGLELMQLEGQAIEDSFLVSIFKVLAENPQMTATQVLEIAQQKGVLLAPAMGRQHSEDLGSLIPREIDILSRDSRFDWIQNEMPDALRERGGTYKIEYRSPLARAMRAQDGLAIMRTFEALPAAMAVDPSAAHVIDVPDAVRELAEINGVPAKLIRDPEQVAELMKQQQMTAAIAAAAGAAPGVSQASLNAAKAEQIRQGGSGA